MGLTITRIHSWHITKVRRSETVNKHRYTVLCFRHSAVDGLWSCCCIQFYVNGRVVTAAVVYSRHWSPQEGRLGRRTAAAGKTGRAANGFQGRLQGQRRSGFVTSYKMTHYTRGEWWWRCGIPVVMSLTALPPKLSYSLPTTHQMLQTSDIERYRLQNSH